MKTFISIIAASLLPLVVFSQSTLNYSNLGIHERKSFFAVEAGYLHSLTNIKITPGTLIGVAKYYDKPGFYIGLYYEANLSKSFTILSQISYQNKGNRTEVISNGGFVKITNNYHYLSVSPLIKIVSLYKMNILIGPEINILADAIADSRNLSRIESGLTGRINYPIEKFVISVSYFKGFNKYDQVGSGTHYFILYNDNIKLGINHILTK